MKHNPRLNEKMARLPGFADIHPLQPQETVQGALRGDQPAGRMADRADRHARRGDEPQGGRAWRAVRPALRSAPRSRRAATRAQVVLVPESAHGTNPATAAFCGYRVENIPATKARPRRSRGAEGAARARTSPAVMITNPNTCGLFEPDMNAISDAVHAAGGFVYCDGANFNAIVGKVRPGDLGIDAMHINLHKTFSTPHGGGGPGSGPVVFSEALDAVRAAAVRREARATAATSWSRRRTRGRASRDSFGRMVAFHGQMGMFTRALTYILSHGADGLAQVAEEACSTPITCCAASRMCSTRRSRTAGPCMHEAIFSDKGFAEGFSTLDRRQGADRRGLPPDDHVFPAGRPRRDAGRADRDRVARPTLDQFIGALRSIAERAKAGDESLRPRRSTRRGGGSTRRWRRRKPVLAYKNPAPDGSSTGLAAHSAAVDGEAQLPALQCRRSRQGVRRQAPAAARNVGPIGDVLAEWLPPSGLVLEIASGTGEHALAFARRFPNLDWQPSDPDPEALASIAAWQAEGPANLQAAAAAGRVRSGLAGRPGRRDPLHQHGPHQPVGGLARPARRRGAAASRRVRR